MSILTLLLTIAIAGFIAWLILQIPMPETFRRIILGVLCLLLVLYVLQLFGVHTGIDLRLR